LYGIKIWIDLYSLLSQSVHLTDRLIARLRLHCMRHGKDVLRVMLEENPCSTQELKCHTWSVVYF